MEAEGGHTYVLYISSVQLDRYVDTCVRCERYVARKTNRGKGGGFGGTGIKLMCRSAGADIGCGKRSLAAFCLHMYVPMAFVIPPGPLSLGHGFA